MRALQYSALRETRARSEVVDRSAQPESQQRPSPRYAQAWPCDARIVIIRVQNLRMTRAVTRRTPKLSKSKRKSSSSLSTRGKLCSARQLTCACLQCVSREGDQARQNPEERNSARPCDLLCPRTLGLILTVTCCKVVYAWDAILSKSPAKNIVIVAHSAGGAGTMYLLKNRSASVNFCVCVKLNV